MIDSIVGSLASTKDAAQSFIEDSGASDASEIEDHGVEAFALLIDAVVARFRVVVSDVTIRLESPPHPLSHLCTAIELRIDWY